MTTKNSWDKLYLYITMDPSLDMVERLWEEPFDTIRIFGDHVELVIVLGIHDMNEALRLRLTYGGTIGRRVVEGQDGKPELVDIES